MIQNLGKMSLGLVAVSVVSTLYILNTPQLPGRFGVGSSSVKSAMQRMQVDNAALKQLSELTPQLAQLSVRRPEQVASIDLGLLGYQKIEPLPPPAAPASISEPEPAPVVVVPPPPPPFEYQISMTYVSGEQRFAVIDGRFYKEGSMMPKGESIVEISPSAVLIARQDKTEWVNIRKTPDTISSNGGVIQSEPSGFNEPTPNQADLTQQVRHES